MALWSLVLLATLGGHLWLWRLPFPVELADRPVLHAQPDRILRIERPDSSTSLLRFDGRPGEAVGVRFEKASLSLSTLALLRSVGLDPPAGEEPLEWLANGAGESKTFLSIELQAPVGENASIEFFQLTESLGSRPYFELRPRGVALLLTMAASATDPFDPATPPRRLQAGNDRWQVPAGLPLSVRVPDGQSLRLRVVGGTRGLPFTGFRLGSDAGTGALRMRAAGVRNPARKVFAVFACSARERGAFWRGAATLAGGNCDRGPALPTLRATTLTIDSSGIGIDAQGTAWLAIDGRADNPPLTRLLAREPRLAGSLLAIDLGLIGIMGWSLWRWRRHGAGMTERPPGIFISYRRSDAAASARLIEERLAERFGADQVFRDIEDIAPGDEFRARIDATLAGCHAVVVVIGPDWLNAMRDGKRRLDDPADIVRQEIEVALERGLLVVPTLVDGAALPTPETLPDSLKALLDRNALEVTDLHFDADMQRLEASIATHLGDTSRSVQQ